MGSVMSGPGRLPPGSRAIPASRSIWPGRDITMEHSTCRPRTHAVGWAQQRSPVAPDLRASGERRAGRATARALDSDVVPTLTT
jgi:hypothetical protein